MSSWFAVREREELRKNSSPFESAYSKKYISAIEEVLDFHSPFYFILARDFDNSGSLVGESASPQYRSPSLRQVQGPDPHR